jgi:hypothetical protein
MSEREVPYNATVSPAPAPETIDPKQFFDIRGKRPMFAPFKMAMFINETYGPFKYLTEGLGRGLPEKHLKKIIILILKDHVTEESIDRVYLCLEGITYPTKVKPAAAHSPGAEESSQNHSEHSQEDVPVSDHQDQQKNQDQPPQ